MKNLDINQKKICKIKTKFEKLYNEKFPKFI